MTAALEPPGRDADPPPVLAATKTPKRRNRAAVGHVPASAGKTKSGRRRAARSGPQSGAKTAALLMPPETPPGAPDALLAVAEVRRRTGLPRSSLYDAIRDGRFPKPLRITARAVRWRESDVEAWIAALRPPTRPGGRSG